MTTLARLRGCSSAEEFFRVLDLPFEQSVLNVSRLHILKRMGEYLRRASIGAQEDDDTVRARCREFLATAYQDFVVSSPIEQRVFKVHQDAVKPKEKPKPAFVSLASLTGTPAAI
jgi:nitrogenase-stabilizing/protective protein